MLNVDLLALGWHSICGVNQLALNWRSLCNIDLPELNWRSLCCLAAWLLCLRRWRRAEVPTIYLLALPLAALPWEHLPLGGADAQLMQLTAAAALAAVQRTGLPQAAMLSGPQVPAAIQVGPSLQVNVTALCAGSSTLLGWVTLGLLVSLLLRLRPLALGQLLAACAFGGVMLNIVRVALCVHAAHFGASAWPAWHTGLSVGVFGCGYLGLFALAARLRPCQRA
jgi:exosortase/archaeosortase family protein